MPCSMACGILARWRRSSSSRVKLLDTFLFDDGDTNVVYSQGAEARPVDHSILDRKDVRGERWVPVFNTIMEVYNPKLADGKWKELKTIKEMNDYVLCFVLTGDGQGNGKNFSSHGN
jgi:hypothetical protein